MAKQTFTASQVLTAAQMNTLQQNDFNQTVSTKTASYTLVATDAGTKIVMNSASATTITVNTSLFAAGDTLKILNIGSGVCTITAGTATVTTSASLALSINAGGTLYFSSSSASVFEANGNANIGLVYVSTTSLTASGQNIANAFSSIYDNYRILINGLVATATNTSISFRLGSSTTRTEYKWAGYNVNVGSGVLASDNGASVTAAQIGYSKGVDGQDTSYVIELQNPNLATRKTYSSIWSNGQFSGTTSGVDSLQTAQTDINIICGTGSITGGTVTIYGYNKA